MFTLPSLRDALAAGRVRKGLVLFSALWCLPCAGSSGGGAANAPNDPNWDRLAAVAQTARAEPAHWLAMATSVVLPGVTRP